MNGSHALIYASLFLQTFSNELDILYTKANQKVPNTRDEKWPIAVPPYCFPNWPPEFSSWERFTLQVPYNKVGLAWTQVYSIEQQL